MIQQYEHFSLFFWDGFGRGRGGMSKREIEKLHYYFRHICLSVSSRVALKKLLYRFSWHLILVNCTKIYLVFQFWLKLGNGNRPTLYAETCLRFRSHFACYSPYIHLRDKTLPTKRGENLNTK
jgi:hypothetical protein